MKLCRHHSVQQDVKSCSIQAGISLIWKGSGYLTYVPTTATAGKKNRLYLPWVVTKLKQLLEAKKHNHNFGTIMWADNASHQPIQIQSYTQPPLPGPIKAKLSIKRFDWHPSAPFTGSSFSYGELFNNGFLFLIQFLAQDLVFLPPPPSAIASSLNSRITISTQRCHLSTVLWPLLNLNIKLSYNYCDHTTLLL
jgi:hypothetical protein